MNHYIIIKRLEHTSDLIHMLIFYLFKLKNSKNVTSIVTIDNELLASTHYHDYL